MRWLTIPVAVASVGCSNPVGSVDSPKLCGLTYDGPECHQQRRTITQVVLTVELRNDDNLLPIHIVTLGEEYGPSNLLEPGASRNVRVTVGAAGFWLTGFGAGRDGMEITNVWCGYSYPYQQPPGPAKVVWDGSRLACREPLHDVDLGS